MTPSQRQQYMKVSTLGRSVSSRSVTHLPLSALDKENTPQNQAPVQQKVDRNELKGKIGLSIKRKISEMGSKLEEGERTPLLDTTSRLTNSLHSANESVRTSSASLSKRVCFEAGEIHSSIRKPALKKKRSILKKSSSRESNCSLLENSKISVASSQCQVVEQSTQHLNGNHNIKVKFEQEAETLRARQQRYTDTIYPPVRSSLYLTNSLMSSYVSSLEKEGRQVEWMRLSELFRNEETVVWTSCKAYKNKISEGYVGKGGFLSTAFSAIRGQNWLLQKMFECQKVNRQGMYLVKIYQTQLNIWKYVPIDDYVPVVIDKRIPLTERYAKGNVYPAFLKVDKAAGPVELWPFLLQKAYAKYYSTYDSLANGNPYDFLEEITGCFLSSAMTEHSQEVLKREDALILAEDHERNLFCMQMQDSLEDKWKVEGARSDPYCFQQLTQCFPLLHYIELHRYFFTSKCMIQQQHFKDKQLQGQPFSLRQFTTDEPSQCQLAVIQKEQRCFRALMAYQYAWMRVIIVQKEPNGYRWISCTYSNTKTIKLNCSLPAGKFVLILMPEWQAKAYDFHLVCKSTVPLTFQRKGKAEHPHIIEDSCMDLAQRYGHMVQVNRSICSYHFIQPNLGFAIENINNEKDGNVHIIRSIEGLEKHSIYPLNAKFLEDKTIDITIPRLGHFTVVLRTKGGVPQQFTRMFNFGI